MVIQAKVKSFDKIDIHPDSHTVSFVDEMAVYCGSVLLFEVEARDLAEAISVFKTAQGGIVNIKDAETNDYWWWIYPWLEDFRIYEGG